MSAIFTGSVLDLVDARAAAVAIVDGNGDQITSIQTTAPIPPASAVLTNVPSSASSVSLLASNASRKKFLIVNDSTKVLKVAYAATASATSFTLLLAAGGIYESDLDDYTGVISGIWTAVNGAARVTEIS
jgi:hypothetical protein